MRWVLGSAHPCAVHDSLLVGMIDIWKRLISRACGKWARTGQRQVVIAAGYGVHSWLRTRVIFQPIDVDCARLLSSVCCYLGSQNPQTSCSNIHPRVCEPALRLPSPVAGRPVGGALCRAEPSHTCGWSHLHPVHTLHCPCVDMSIPPFTYPNRSPFHAMIQARYALV